MYTRISHVRRHAQNLARTIDPPSGQSLFRQSIDTTAPVNSTYCTSYTVFSYSTWIHTILLMLAHLFKKFTFSNGS